MPRKKRIRTRAERTAEEFFPVEPTDIKQAVEKIVKPFEQTIIPTSSAAKPIKKERKTSTKKLTARTEKFKPKNIQLKKDGYELIVTEKPQAALKIANALGKVSAKNHKGVAYYEVERPGKSGKIVVACAVGHLFTLKQKNNGEKLPVFDIIWVPNFQAKKKDFSKKYYETLAALIKNAGLLTIATDYDIEGEVIGLNIARFIANQKDANRMKFSTLTEKELNEAYEAKSKSLNWGQAIAGETRHYLDWYYGINLSRALMNAIKSTGKFRVFSIGRVQGPALNLIVQKERQILQFKPQPYWQVFIELEKPKIQLQHNKDIFKKQELEKFHGLKEGIADVTTEKKRQTLPPNPPFNLTALQTEAYRLFGFNPARTLQLAQSLYLSGLISYPRTSSQKLPLSINYKPILEKLADRYNVKHLIKRDKPIEGSKSDPAHPSIYPTGNTLEGISDDERKVYDLTVKRFLSLFCEDAIIDNKTIIAKADGLIFMAKGSVILHKGWLNIYPVKIPESHIPDANGKIKIIDVKTVEKETQPPRRYTPASLVSELEKKQLGTKTTRASIIETLYDRGYIKDQSIEATPIGISLIETLEKHSPIIIDQALTRQFEKDMDAIQTAKHGLEAKEEAVKDKAKEAIKGIINQFEKEGKAIGEELVKAQEEDRNAEKEKNKIMLCPACKKGSLAITYSKKNRKFFIACDAYPECKTTFSLPPYGLIKKIEPKKQCEKCSWPLLMSIQKGKRPWIFCFNSNCDTNKERIRKYKENQNGSQGN